MTKPFFQTQINRLITRFGQKAFDQEFVHLVWHECHDMSEPGFRRFCDVLIGSRTANKPPLLSEFREARINEQALQFENDTKAAARILSKRAPGEMREHMRKTLAKDFGAVDSIVDALEIARLRNRIKPDDDGPGAA